jgi:hypothetical protein
MLSTGDCGQLFAYLQDFVPRMARFRPFMQENGQNGVLAILEKL